MIHKEKTPCLHLRKEERRQKVQEGSKNLDAGMDTSAPLVGCRGVQHRGREEGRCQCMEEVTGHCMKLGFYSKGSEKYLESFNRGEACSGLHFKMVPLAAIWRMN